MNALNRMGLSEIKIALQEAGKDEDVGVAVLTGAGRAFSAGCLTQAIRRTSFKLENIV